MKDQTTPYGVKAGTCAHCGKRMWRGAGSLPQGVAMCQPCRRIHPQRSDKRTPCVDCSAPSLGLRCRTCADQFQRADKTTDDVVAARRELRRRRAARDRLAPGLTQAQRLHLRAKWIRQRRACAYCPALATQVDHVIPLALGGTNYIGNLAPVCADCNRAKCDNLLIEWRTGKKARRMRWQVPTEPRSPRPRRAKVWVDVALSICPMCSALHARRKYCSAECAHEGNATDQRNAYRTRVGIPIDAPLWASLRTG